MTIKPVKENNTAGLINIKMCFRALNNVLTQLLAEHPPQAVSIQSRTLYNPDESHLMGMLS
jgi:hypothetical protein